jgi:signal transduction histidine kinase
MSSGWRDRFRHALVLRLAVWYGVLFVAGAVAMVALTYLLLSRSLEARDRELVEATLERYVTEYRDRGLEALNETISADSAEGRHERLLVRVSGRRGEAIFFNVPPGWDEFDLSGLDDVPASSSPAWTRLRGLRDRSVLEVASARLADGTLVQVGRSSAAREETLEHFRSRVLVVFVSILTVAVAGGALLTYVGLAPLRALTATVRTIVQTGRIDARVPVSRTGDMLDELGVLFNGMLDRIEALIGAMREALDNVAHDLRTPLARLRGVAEAALASDDPDATREALLRAIEEAERVTTMLTALMDITEAERGAMRLVRQPVPLPALVADACDLYADLAEEKQIAIEVRVPPLTVDVDEARVRQVLANLIDNAVKYTPGGGRVWIEARADGPSVVVEVGDTGIGIGEAELPRVWERLYRGDASRSARGLGLGLSLVKAIVEAHGGCVAVRSRPGQGSVFTVTLPAAQPRA